MVMSGRFNFTDMRHGTSLLKRGFAKMQEGGVIMDVVTPEEAHIAEDAGAPVGQVGTLVSSLIDTSGTHSNFSDADGDLPGIAITGVNLQGGALWYSSDDGSTWLDVGAVGHRMRKQRPSQASQK